MLVKYTIFLKDKKLHRFIDVQVLVPIDTQVFIEKTVLEVFRVGQNLDKYIEIPFKGTQFCFEQYESVHLRLIKTTQSQIDEIELIENLLKTGWIEIID